ncbi:MAG: penicillin-binding protein 2 [Candidatus Uhrbacteria bacterium]|nr:penicillin-binding protein 2 [Candidatus Uhrbacteria bacterium]
MVGNKGRNSSLSHAWRLKALRFFFSTFVIVLIFRLFTLQVINASFYDALASGQHNFYKELFAERGSIFVRDWKDGGEYLAATNEPRAFVYANPRKIEDPIKVAYDISKILGYEIIYERDSDSEVDELSLIADELSLGIEESTNDGAELAEVAEVLSEEEEEGPLEYQLLLDRLSKEDDPYEPIARNIDEKTLEELLALEIDGLGYVLEAARSYPETNLGGHIFGFVGQDNNSQKVGSYGIEGYFNDFLAGVNGYLDTETDASGRWIGVGTRNFEPAVDGGDLLLTIDRTIQYVACQKLREGVETYDADGGSLVIIEPSTGKIMAMCSAPDFDPNKYNEVEDASVYNNSAIFEAYEPGSVFKSLVMAGAIDAGDVTPTTTYEDTGEVQVDEYTIQNSDLKANGIQTMTEVLEKSLNTGMVFVMREMGRDALKDYIERFGFGMLSGIELNTESSGTIASLDEFAESYFATASYGQGIMVTPLQLAVAYAALANGGQLMKPYIVEEVRYSNGTVEERKPKVVRQVVSKKTATTIGAMLVAVVENGHASKAGVDGYYIGGKTGTAQVAKSNSRGYETDKVMATFVGSGPIEDPKFTMLVLLNAQRAVPWAADSAAPIFGDIADFLLQYLEVAPTRPVE